ncbi:DNA methyltransferase [Pseudoflavonifractor sp. An85]|uniref:DNA methyltransferase n=1 Tax=Pseudoflavonifractor sp. An85 TaxID=1965661 RepID=UPI000B36874E|nr:DNA methyltransferase [Pseudoflavonifractor sp. An85]OUN25981.1 methylase [Pseudoflavonifractor sp. An85]
MTDAQRRAAAKEFAAQWAGKGYEKGQSQSFWLSLLRDVYGVEHPEAFITFEDQIMLDHTSFIDGFIPATHVLIEQKSLGKDLNKPIRQSDGTLLSPFQQAKRYSAELPYSQRPRWIVTCNFSQFYVYDMEWPTGEPEIIELKDLEREHYRLQFLVDTGDTNIHKEMEVSLEAGRIVGVLYDALLAQYKDPESEETLKHLNALCVRLVFCLYAEDAGIFGHRNMFHNYLQHHISDARRALMDLFEVLNTKPEDRDPYLEEDLATFPYVNGGLFAEKSVIPRLDETIVDLILHQASEDFDWSVISPTIFGAVFESTLNPDTRRKGGMHYTSIENIHKVIDPLFLDSLRDELAQIFEITVEKTRMTKLKAFQAMLAGLTFLDPACGSGNFLTETYLSLRRMENEVIAALHHDQITLDMDNPIQVSINQFYGIEINDFAVTVARTALWIAESQMMKETEDVVHMSLDFLPLKTNASIVEGNALRLDWESVVPKDKLDYIMGNPPFVGYSLQSKEQKEDLLSIYVDEKGKPYKTAGKIDYVSGWYFKAAQLMQGSGIRTAFVSTNSITQGEQVAGVWKPLYDRFGIHIDFAHRTFRWDSEASLKAHVHCVIVGFSIAPNSEKKRIYTSERFQEVQNINAYLIDAPDVFIESRNRSLSPVPEMVYGNKPTDGGFLFLTPEEYHQAVKNEPEISKCLKRIYGATEYINNKMRYCLWLVGASPSEIRKSKFIMDRVEAVRQFRLNSTKAATQKSAESPTLFQEIRHPNSEYIIVPRHSSETRKYVPFGFVSPDIIVNDAVQIIPGANLYHFGTLMSNVHMAWMRAVCGRIKSDYRYSKDIVYNNFPWPTPTEAQKAKIEQTAQGILDARALYPDCSLADLYDEVTMPPELRKAHQQNDRAVMQAYGFDVKTTTESSCVAKLMKMYQELTMN